MGGYVDSEDARSYVWRRAKQRRLDSSDWACRACTGLPCIFPTGRRGIGTEMGRPGAAALSQRASRGARGRGASGALLPSHRPRDSPAGAPCRMAVAIASQCVLPAAFLAAAACPSGPFLALSPSLAPFPPLSSRCPGREPGARSQEAVHPGRLSESPPTPPRHLTRR
ncbi:hypothetical protein B2J93_444 [Marssonina coronariae]|uniref:Uncharacterized protein n=1 Tax=Diplocarpon coronariae TaxID=2795749 RepID=A0A218YSQ3_9HELO|nr:hypothetical protein B2J93_444 [Marssonina coronariae]